MTNTRTHYNKKLFTNSQKLDCCGRCANKEKALQTNNRLTTMQCNTLYLAWKPFLCLAIYLETERFPISEWFGYFVIRTFWVNIEHSISLLFLIFASISRNFRIQYIHILFSSQIETGHAKFGILCTQTKTL